MALLWMDGFEQFTTGGNRTVLDPVYDFSGATATGDIGVIASTRVTGKMVSHDEGGTQIGVPEMLRLPITSPTGSTTWIVGFAYYVNHPNYEETELLQFLDSGGSAMITLKCRAGSLHARRGDIDGTVLGMADASLPCTVWYYIECKVTFHDTTGSIEVRVNEETVMNLTNIDTKPGAASTPSFVYVAGSNSSMGVFLDDYYICDAAGSVNNDFLGDIGIRRLSPTEDGNPIQMTGSDGNSVENFALVDDDSPDSDTTYVVGDAVNEKDLYHFADLPSTPAAIACLSVVTFARKTDSGTRTFIHTVRSNTIESDSAAISPLETYKHEYSFFPLDPNTSAAWTESGVNAMTAGYEVAS